MDLEDLTDTRMISVEDPLTNDGLVIRKKSFEKLVVVGGDHRVRANFL